MSPINVFVRRVREVVPARKIDGGNTKFGSDKRDVREGTLSSLEALCGDVSLEVVIVALVVNGVIHFSTVKFDKEFESIKVIGQLVMLMSEAKVFSPNPADFLFASKQ